MDVYSCPSYKRARSALAVYFTERKSRAQVKLEQRYHSSLPEMFQGKKTQNQIVGMYVCVYYIIL